MNFEDWPEPMKIYSERMSSLFGIPVSNWSQVGDTLQVRFGKGNDDYKDSEYFLNPAGLTFSHLTTYRGLFGILIQDQSGFTI